MTSSSPDDRRKSLLQDLHKGLEQWIPKRKNTITAMKEIADKIHQVGKGTGISKVVGSSVGIAAGVTAGILGAVAIFATGGLATPFVVVGAVAGVAGVGGALTAGGADIAKAIKLPKLMEEARGKIDDEIDAYHTIILKLKALSEDVADKTELDIPSHASNSALGVPNVGKALPVALVNLLQTYSNMCIHVSEIAAIAAAEAAATVAAQTAQSVGATEQLAVKAATEAAEKAASSIAVGALLKGVSKNTCKSIAKASGKAAGEAAVRAASKASKSTSTIKATAESAARPAAKLAAKEALKATVQVMGETTGKTAGIAGKAAAPVIVTSALIALPFLNFGFAAWDTYETVNASKQLYAGPEEERLLKEKIEKLKEEANDIVVTIYNFLAEPLKLPLIDTPYPEL